MMKRRTRTRRCSKCTAPKNTTSQGQWNSISRDRARVTSRCVQINLETIKKKPSKVSRDIHTIIQRYNVQTGSFFSFLCLKNMYVQRDTYYFFFLSPNIIYSPSSELTAVICHVSRRPPRAHTVDVFRLCHDRFDIRHRMNQCVCNNNYYVVVVWNRLPPRIYMFPDYEKLNIL